MKKTLLQLCDDAGSLLAASQNLAGLLTRLSKELAITPNANEKLIRSRLYAAGVKPALARLFIVRYKKALAARPLLDAEDNTQAFPVPQTAEDFAAFRLEGDRQ